MVKIALRKISTLHKTPLRFIVLFAVIVLYPMALFAESVAVRFTEGLIHGFLVLRTLEGTPIADGDLTQISRGGRVTNRLVFRFKDGSIHEETAVYTQRGQFRLLTDHLVQKGPSFKRAVETFLDASTGRFTVRYTEEDGKEKVKSESLKLPEDVYNGMVFTILKNIQPGMTSSTISMVAATPKPRIVKLMIGPQGKESFAIGASTRKAIHYVIKVEIGGAAGLVAPLVGKQPPDIHVWILESDAPAFVKSELPLYEGGPIWRIELAIPNRP